MNNTHGDPNAGHQDRLRRSARNLLDQGAAPRNSGGTLGVDALQLLFKRASNPETAADALKLLHELQTYQVELDLLYEQLLANEQELTEELTHYKALFEFAPAAYLTMTRDGAITEGNHAAGMLLGNSPDALAGMKLTTLLAPGQDDKVAALLGAAGNKDVGEHGTVERTADLPDHQRIVIRARPAPATDSILMILSETATHTTGF
ncbi:PAS domain S-box protein [Marinobacter segnicrescens]|uniref:PAS domain S-box protein n=1 Tax=Marinobacter segnicrescens TaxID=430453 RepID=UPI003A94C478